jgi:hypothetical protein
VRPDWWADEVAKLLRAATDPRWRVREMVAAALQRLLAADWDPTVVALLGWVRHEDPLVVRAAVAAVAEPPLLTDPERVRAAGDLQRRALEQFNTYPPHWRTSEEVRTLRKALGFTISVVAAADGDFSLLENLAASTDPDLRWVLKENLKKARLLRWPDQVERVRSLLLHIE